MAGRWIQKIIPFLDDKKLYVYSGGKVLTDWYEWCLAVVDACFGVAPFAASAIKAWEVNTTKHWDGGMSIPIGFYVPVFYKGGKYGHVVVAYRESYEKIKVWSSPYTHKAYFDYFEGPVVETLDKIGRIYGCSYIGWTETLGDKRIIQWENVPDPKPAEPTLTWKKFDEVVKYRTKLEPTHLWGVNTADWNKVQDLEQFKQGEVVDIAGSVFNKELENTYLVTPYYFNRKEAVGFNQGDMDIVQPEPEPEAQEEDIPATDEGSGDLSQDTGETNTIDDNDASEGGSVKPEQPPVVISEEEANKLLEENVIFMEKFTDLVAEAGKGLNFSPLTKKIVYIVGDLLLLAGVEVAPVMAVIGAQNAQEISQALTQALFTAGVGILLIFKLLKAKSAKQLSEDKPSES